MKIIEKIIRVDKDVNGGLSINGEGSFAHSISMRQVFFDMKDAKEYADDKGYGYDEVREDFYNSFSIDAIEVEEVEEENDIYEMSIDSIGSHELDEVIRKYPNYEVKDMFYEIDGFKSIKKVLVLKPFDEKIAVSKLEVA